MLPPMMLAWPPEQPTLTAGSMVLRPWHTGDVPAVRLACQDPDIQHFTTVPRPYLLVHAQEFIAAGARLFAERQGVNYAICDSDDRMLGAISFVAIDAPARQAEIGYWVAPWGRGQRVATTAVGLLADWGRLIGLQEFILRIDRANASSLAVAARSGAICIDRLDHRAETPDAGPRLRVFRLI